MTNQNDTDPQSPRARASRTDPGLGSSSPRPLAASSARPAAAVADEPPRKPQPSVPLAFDGAPPRVKPLTPVPASSSIDTLLDGITGPRPPFPKPPAPVASSDAIAPTPPPAASIAARPPPVEDAEVTPPPPSLARARISRRPDGSIRPVVQRTHDTTVYTARKAMLRNGAAVLLSAAVVALLLFGFVHWSDARRGAASAAARGESQAQPPPFDTALPPMGTPVAVVAPAESAAAGAVTSPPASASVGKAASSVRSRAPAGGSVKRAAPAATSSAPEPKKAAHPGDDLDDLNRQIRH